MNEEPFENAYAAPQVTEESLDSGGNYVEASAEGGGGNTLGLSGVDPE
ncbi:MAG: hypothetical protein GX571_07900 [Lentisphaerae bacterium]|jgi:hypothetical protein|nr:hypothetical protein [Lentisphaerota bacterium]